MAGWTRRRHAKTAKGQRVLESREPQTFEDAKVAVFMRGTGSSATISAVMDDLCSLKKPHAVVLQRKNPIHPFEGGESEASLEFLARRSGASFALLGSSSKKRPNNLVIARMFDNRLMDMAEVAVTAYTSIAAVGGPTCALGLKPAFVFSGDLFETNVEYKMVQNMLLDLFRGQIVSSLNLAGLEHAICVTATEGAILFRVYRIALLKSGTRVPAVKLHLMGPSIDFALGRTRMAPSETMKQALRKPRVLDPKRIKNVSTTPLGQTMGRVHVGKQMLDTIQVRKVKAFKASAHQPPTADDDEQEEAEEQAEQESIPESVVATKSKKTKAKALFEGVDGEMAVQKVAKRSGEKEKSDKKKGDKKKGEESSSRKKAKKEVSPYDTVEGIVKPVKKRRL